MAPVAKKAGKADTEDRSVQPGFALWVFPHEKESLQSSVLNAEKIVLRLGEKSHDIPAAQNSRRIRLFLGGTIQDYTHFFEGDQSAFHHLIQTRKNCLDPLRRFDHFDNDRQILRHA